jgi:hypothetical protein
MFFGLALAGLAGWAGDDICPPPRPWPWPWLLRKLIAVIGGCGCYWLFAGRLGIPETGFDSVSTILLGITGGIALPSIIGGIAGGGRAGPSQ